MPKSYKPGKNESGETISRRRFIESGSLAGLGGLILTGCGRTPSNDSMVGLFVNNPTTPNKWDYFAYRFFGGSGASGQPLPETTLLRSFGLIFNSVDQNGWHTKVQCSATIEDTFIINSYHDGYPNVYDWNRIIHVAAGGNFELSFDKVRESGYFETLVGNPLTQVTVIYEYGKNNRIIARLATTPPQMISKSLSTVIDEKTIATGASIINSNMEAITASYTLRKADGTNPMTAQRTIQGGAKRGDYFFTMAEFATALQESFSGTMTIETSKPVAIFSLSHDADFAHLREHPTGNNLETVLLYPYAPIRSIDSTAVDLIPGDQDATYTIQFRNQDGTPRTITSEFHGAASTFTIAVPANNVQRFLPSANDSHGVLQNSSGSMTITKPPGARADVYNLHDNQERYMPPSNDAPEQRIILYGDAQIALYNPNAEQSITAVQLRHQNGTIFTAMLILEARQQIEGPLSSLINYSLTDFNGTVHFRNTNAAFEEQAIAISAFSSTDADDLDRMTIPFAVGGYYPDLVRLIVTPNDLSFLKRIDQLPALDGIPEVTGDAILYINGKARPLPATGANIWAPVGVTITLDMEHPQYCREFTVARTNLQSGITIGYKDSLQNLEIKITNEMKGQTIPLYLLQRRNF